MSKKHARRAHTTQGVFFRSFKRSKIPTKVVSVIMSFVMIFSCSSNTPIPLGQAWGSSQVSTQQTGTTDSGTSGTSESAAGTGGQADTPESSSASAGTDSSASSTSNDTAATGNNSTGATSHQAISADLPVTISFTLDGIAADPAPVKLQLQSRTATWDASTSAWTDFGSWTETGAPVNLTADAATSYTFKSLALQTVTETGAYAARTQYRAIASAVDGADLTYQTTADGSLIYTAAASATDAKTANYTVSSPEEPALIVNTDSTGADAAKVAGDTSETISVAGTTVRTTSALSLNPQASDHTVTFSVNGDTTKVAAQTVADGNTATKPSDPAVTGATFVGWYADATPTASSTAYDFTTPVTGDLTLTALLNWTYTVTNSTYNYADGDTTTYKLSKDAQVTINGTTTSVAAGTTFEVPANATFTVTCALPTDDDVTLTMVPKTGQSAIGATAATLNSKAATAELKSQEAAADIDLRKEWKDGGVTSKPALDLAIQFSSDTGATWTTLTAATMATLGLTAVPAIPSHSSSTSTWIYSFEKSLPEYTTAGTKVIYRLSENTVPAGYVSSYSGDNSTTLVNTSLNAYTATKKWADGSNKYSTRIDAAKLVNTLTCKKASLSGDPVDVALTTTDSTAEGYIQIAQSGNSWSILMPNARGFDANDFPYSYYLTEPDSTDVATGSTAISGTVYKPTYENDGNYASISTALYNGGTITNSLSNSTKFTATKKWADDENTEIAGRPTATIELFRYPDDGTSSYETASPVPNVASSTLDNTATASFTFTIPSDTSTLPAYDEAGNKYIYFAKETLSGGTNAYKKVFKDNGSEKGNDTFLFNGGELDNTITGTVNKQVTKKWAATARQDVDAKVTISIDQYDYQNNLVKTSYATQDLTGFGTENPAKTADFSGLPMYDENGRKYIYKVTESGLQTNVGGTLEKCTMSADGTSFVTADGYRYTTNQVEDGDATTITNTLVGNAQVTITKSFPDGLLATPSDLTYTIYQNGTKIGTKSVSVSALPVDPITITSYGDMDAGSYTGSGLLPRYSESGAQYTYTVAETSKPSEYATSTSNRMKEGTYAEGTANAGQKYSYDDASISNYKPVESMGVSVSKTWIDASDVMNRETVHLALQYNAGTAEVPNWVTVNTGSIDPSTDYTWISVPATVPAGSTGTDTYQDLYKAWIAAGRTVDAAGAFRIVETALGSDNVVADGDAGITADSGHQSGYSFVSTANQNYDVSAEATITSDYGYAVTNTRVGTEKIILTKNWIDGSDSKSVRPASVTFTVTASSAVFNGSTTKDFTATGTGNTWSLDTGWLQKYDSATGAFITYTIAESTASTTAVQNLGYAISGKQTSYTVGAHHTGDIETWEYTNALSGSVTPLMNKIWKDLSDDATIRSRPDIYPVLIRSYTDGTGTHYEKMTYQDRDWDTKVVTDSWWQCKFVSQPRYNAEGYEYTYYVAEAFSSTSHGDYVTSGGYTNAPNADGSFDEGTATSDSITVDGTTYSVARLDNDTGTAGTIVNKPVATRVVSGQKLWTNLPEGFSKSNLPDVTFELYRCSYAYRNDPLNAPDLTDVGQSATLKSGASTFSFPTSVARYDNEGKPYTYVVKETAPGTMDVAYAITEDPTNGLVVTNEFKKDQTYGVTFTKNWSWPTGYTVPAGQEPTVKLTLARYLTDPEGNVIAGTRSADFATTANNTHANAVDITSADTTVDWTKLAYYGPNGNPYKYVVEESSVPNGYVVYNAAGTGTITPTTINGTTVYEAAVTGSTTAGTAGITNKYGEVLGKLSLTKDWAADQAYDVSPRPSSILVNLYRTSTTGGKEQVQSNVELTSAENWTKTIEGLEVYSPKGEQYAYSFEEVSVPTGYTAAYSPATATLSTTATAALKATNTSSTTSLSVTKNWKYGTDTTPTSAQLLFDAGLAGVPTTITYRFQYSTDGGTSWTDLLKADATTHVEQQISQAANGSFPSASISSLPTNIMVGTQVKGASYRAYEYSITYSDGSTKTRAEAPTGATDDDTIATVATKGTGTTTAGSTTAGTTTVANTVPMRKITISKKWDDEYNRDGVRPASISFDITRTGVETASDTQKETVTLTSANKTDDNTWTADYYVPIYWNVGQTAKSSYTVAENTTSSAAAGYTAYAGTTADPTTAGASVSIGGETADASAYFKNSRTHGTYDVATAKKWTDGTAIYDGTTTIPEWLQAYLPTSLTFHLQAETKDASGTVVTAWTDIDSTAFGTDFTGIEKSRTGTVDTTNGTLSSVSWTGLPKYASDTVTTNLVTYHYRVVEDLVAPQSTVFQTTYSSSDVTAAGTVTTTNSLDVTKLAMTKTWSDQNNNCNTRPDAIKYTAQYSTDGTTWTTVPDSWTNGATTDGTITAAKANSYNTSLDMLPKYKSDGVTKYQYRAVETALIYGTAEIAPGASESDAKPYYVSSTTTSADSGSVTTYTTAFTNTLVYTTFSVTKHWVDSTPSIASQVSEIRYYLQQSSDNGSTWTYVLGSDGKTKDYWSIGTSGSAADVSKTMDRLPKYDSQGRPYQYRAVEASIKVGSNYVSATNLSQTDPTSGTVGGFTDASTTSGSTTTITNTAVTTGTTASKVWKDNSGGNNSLPSAITFRLKQGTTTLGATFDKILSNPWSAVSWTGLPASNAAGTAYTYSVSEDQVPGYTTGIAGTQAAGYTITNTPIPVNISKVATGGTAKLAGATFTLTGTFTNGTGEETKNWTSSATDVWNLAGLLVQNNVYTLTETAPPKGYTLPSATTTYLKVDTAGNLYKSTDKATWTAVTSNALAVSDAANKVTITKTDGTKNLAGATFTVTGTFVDAADQTKTTAANATITTDANPFVLTGRFIAGNTYTVAETTVPNGYLTMQSNFTVTMGADGHLTAGTLPTGATVTIGYDATNGATITVADQPTVLRAAKYATTDTAHATPIAGAVFTVTPVGEAKFADNTTAAKTITSTNSTTNLGNLTSALITGNEYTIQETTAPAGYQLANPEVKHTIRITNAGQLQENVGGTWTDVANNAMAFEDYATAISLTKQDEDTQAKIGGSTYTLTGTFADGSTSQTLNPTASDAAALSTKIIANETSYTLKEGTPIPGYKASPLTDSYPDATLTNGAMTLKMDAVGKLYYQTATGWTAVEGNALVMKDAQNALTITKVTDPAITSPAATFTIRGTFSDSGGQPETRTILDNATSATMTGKLIAGQSYAISEITPPVGYCAVSDFSITMNADGTITTTTPSGVALTTGTNGNPVLTATDPQTKVTLTKTGTGGKLSGAIFTITRADGGTFVDGTTAMTWNTTDKNGFDSTNFVAGQTYKFSETAIPNGYEKIADFSVTMSLAGKLQASGTIPSGVTIGTTSVTIANTQNSVKIVKAAGGIVDPTAATFTVNGTFTDKTDVTKTVTETRSYSVGAGANAATLTGEMISGQAYTVTETVPPSSYQTIASSFQVAMGEGGTLSVVGTLPDGATLATDGLTLTITDPENSFSLTKTGANGNLSGATFTLTDTSGAMLADNTASYQVVTAATASAITGKLIASTAATTHTYKLEETTPAPGYTVTAPIYLRANTAGSLSSGTTADGTFTAVDNNALTLTDVQNNLTLTKKNADGSTTLTGATFTIKPAAAGGKFADGTVDAKPLPSDSSNFKGELVAGTNYTVTETVPPAGYYIATAAFTVAMDNYGVLTATGGTGVSVTNGASSTNPGGTAAITVNNPQNTFSVTKAGLGGSAIAGAQFELSGVNGSTFAHATAPITWSSTTSAYVITGELVAGGVYKLSETAPAAGYTTASDVYLKIDENGILSQSADQTAWTPVGTSATTNALTVSDVQNKVTLNKVDDKTPTPGALVGSQFTVTAEQGKAFADGDTSKTMLGAAISTDNLIGQMVAGATYTFSETTAPAGYLTVPDFKVTMGADGKLSVAAGTTLPDGTAGTGSVALTYASSTNTITVTDAEDSVTLKKTDASTNGDLAGSTFTVTGDFVGGGTSITMLSGTVSQTLKDTFIAGNTYTFTESTCPALYKTMDPFQVTVNSDGTLTLATTGRTDVSIQGTVITAANTQLHAGMTLTKIDATSGAAIPNVQFTLSGPTAFNNGNALTLTTDASGIIATTNLPKGSYTLTEITPCTNANYVSAEYSATFTVSDNCKDKTLAFTNDATTNNASLFSLDTTGLGATGLANVRQTGSVIIQKNGKDADASGLDGVTFALYRSDDTPVTTGVTANGGALTFSGLTWGDYYFVETAVPAGYQVDSTKHAFSIGYDALTKKFTDTSAITNNKNTFTLTKNTAGATFTITGELADGTGSTTLTGATSYIETGLLVGGKTYTVTETVPPQGYKTVAPFTVTMGTNGALTAADLPDGVTLANNVITVTDSQNAFTVTKNDEQGKTLGGVTFELRTTDATAALVDTWTTDADSKGSIENPHSVTGKLTAGTVYRLTEARPSFGYTAAADTFLKMDTAGQLWSDASATGTFSTKVESNALVIADSLTSLSFTKLDTDGKTQLAGARLEFAATISTFTVGFNVESLSDQAAVASGKMAAGLEYTVSESKPAPGHLISPWTDTYHNAALNSAGDLIVRMENPGQLQYKTGTDTWADITGNAIAMKDAQNSVSISKVDATDTTKLLAGAQFTLSGKFADSSKTEGSVTWYSSATEAHVIEGQLISGNVYKLHEDAPAAGYTVAADRYLKVDDAGALWVSDTEGGTYEQYANPELAVADAQNSVSISKVDATDTTKLLAGAEFSLSGTFATDGVADTSSSVITWTSTASAPTGLSDGLLAGKLIVGSVYKLAETSPAPGYTLAADIYLKIDAAGQLWSDTSATGTFDTKVVGNVLDVADSQNTFNLTKTGENGQSLDGATFELRTNDTAATLVGSWTLANGQTTHDFTGLMVADTVYSLIETVPAPGYTSADFVSLKMDKDGTLEQRANGTDRWSKVTDNKLSIADTLNNIDIAKFDADGTTQLGGAQFTLAGIFADGTGSEGSTSWYSDATDAKNFTGQLIAGNSYKLTENTPAPGHVLSAWTAAYTDAVLDTGALVIEVDQNGLLYYQSTNVSGWTPLQGNAIAMRDGQNAISIQKVDANGEALSGAQFTLSGTFADGSNAPGSFTWTSGTDAKTFIDQLTAGNVYKLHEDIPAEGYTVAADVYLKVDNAGALWTCATAGGTFEAYASNALTVADTQNDVTISKTDATGTALANSTFSLSGTFAGGSTSPITWTSTDSAYDLTGKLVAGNVYKLTETSPAPGYTTAADVYLKVDNDGVLWTDSSATGTFSTKVTDDALLVKDVQNSYDFQKKNDGDEMLTGATFKLTPAKGSAFADGSASIDLFSGNDVANVTGKFIAGNSYIITEVIMPAGYTAIDPITVTVAADGRHLTFSPQSEHLKITDTADGATVTVFDDPVAIVIQKTDSDGKQLANHKDCTFKITPVGTATFADGSTTPITGNDDAITTALRGKLIASPDGGTRIVYSIQEMKEPGGYQIEPTAVNFFLDSHGNVFALNGEGTIIKSAEGVPDLLFADPPIVTNFQKTDADGTAIDGATFTVAGTFADGTTSKTVSPSATTSASISNQIIADNTYTLTETATPAGYVALTSPITFTVDNLGAITIKDNPEDAASVGSDKTTLVVKNQLTPEEGVTADTVQSQTAKTGDGSPFTLAGIIEALGLTALAYAGFKRRKYRKEA